MLGAPEQASHHGREVGQALILDEVEAEVDGGEAAVLQHETEMKKLNIWDNQHNVEVHSPDSQPWRLPVCGQSPTSLRHCTGEVYLLQRH